MRFSNSHSLAVRALITTATALATAFALPLASPLSAQATHPTTTTAQPRPMTPTATPKVAGPAAPKATTADLANNHPVSPPGTPGTPGTSGASAMPQAGFYTLAMTASKINGHAAGSDHIISEDVGVSWSGAEVSISGNGLAFKGNVVNNHLSATSHTAEGNIVLTGTPAAHYASGTFTLRQPDGNNASGGFTLTAPSQQHMAKKLKPYGASNTGSNSGCSAWCSFKKWWASFTL